MNNQTGLNDKDHAEGQSLLNDGLGARLTKCLKRIAEGKSKPDFNAVCKLDDLGYIKISGTSDDVSIELTNKGINYLASNVKLTRPPISAEQTEK